MDGTEIRLQLDEQLLASTISGTVLGLQMANVTPVPVGATRLVSARHRITVMVGLVGKHSGSMALNLSEPAMLFLAGRLLAEDQTVLSEDNIDAIMEIGNMVAGSIKTPLRSTGYEIDQISLPSLIMGQSYNMMYARGINTIAVEFEITEMPYASLTDRFFTTSVSLLRGAGK
jgi:CheY-specific phosphatase CheX